MYDNNGNGNVQAVGFGTDHAAAVIVLGSLALLILIRRGFRGVGVPGVASLRVG